MKTILVLQQPYEERLIRTACGANHLDVAKIFTVEDDWAEEIIEIAGRQSGNSDGSEPARAARTS